MTRLLEILISLAIVAALFLIVGLVLPSSRYLVERVETNRKLTIVYDTLNNFSRFKDWNAIPLRDPKMETRISGPESGVGAEFHYSSNKSEVGSGTWKIVESVPNELVAIQIDNDRQGKDKRTEFKLKSTGKNNRNVEIMQTYKVNYGWNLVGRYAGLYVRSHVGDDMKFGLAKLTNMLASIPNIDHTVYGEKLTGLSVTQVPAEHLLFVPAGTLEFDDVVIEKSMRANMEWITRTMAANGLVAAGPMRIVTSEQGRETYTFDVAQPVRRATDAEGAAATAELTGLSLQGPVKYQLTPARRAVSAKFIGYIRELENVRNALRAWSAPRGYEITDRPYEVYDSGIDGAFKEDGQFTAYWAIK
ncbi:MAG: polyketide cyclase [Pseudomonadota bacterium]